MKSSRDLDLRKKEERNFCKKKRVFPRLVGVTKWDAIRGDNVGSRFFGAIRQGSVRRGSSFFFLSTRGRGQVREKKKLFLFVQAQVLPSPKLWEGSRERLSSFPGRLATEAA
jgi:hypothetical protein